MIHDIVGSMTTLSVLLCTYNRPKLLDQALASLVEKTIEKPNQIVVVNGGDENTDLAVRHLQKTSPVSIQLVKTINRNLAASRNIGLHHCTGEIIAMTDDDAEVSPDWVTQMKRLHSEHPEAGAIGGLVIGTNTHTLVGKVADKITFPSWPEQRRVRTLPGVNISYKKNVIEQIGSQDETLFRGEDVDFNWRVQRLGYSILYDPSVKVFHHHRPTVKGFLNQHYMYGRAYYLVRRKWPEMYCVYPHGLRNMKDFLKALNFLAALAYQPFLTARKIPSKADRIKALPLLFAAGFAWKGGMLAEKLRPTYPGAA
jgi:GT2 family glycosyltransferase